MSEQDEKTERRLRTALHAAGSEAPAPADLWVRIEPRLEGSTTTSTWWQRGWASLAVGVAATVVLAVGATGIALVAAGLTAGNGDGNSFGLAFRSDDSAGLSEYLDVDDGADTRRLRALTEEQSSNALAVPASQPTGTPAPSIVWGPSGGAGPVDTLRAVQRPSADGQDSQVFNSERQVISQASLTARGSRRRHGHHRAPRLRESRLEALSSTSPRQTALSPDAAPQPSACLSSSSTTRSTASRRLARCSDRALVRPTSQVTPSTSAAQLRSERSA